MQNLEEDGEKISTRQKAETSEIAITKFNDSHVDPREAYQKVRERMLELEIEREEQ